MLTMIKATNGLVLVSAVQAVLYSSPVPSQAEIDAGANMPNATLLLANGANLLTGRPFDEVVTELQSANGPAADPQPAPLDATPEDTTPDPPSHRARGRR